MNIIAKQSFLAVALITSCSLFAKPVFKPLTNEEQQFVKKLVLNSELAPSLLKGGFDAQYIDGVLSGSNTEISVFKGDTTKKNINSFIKTANKNTARSQKWGVLIIDSKTLKSLMDANRYPKRFNFVQSTRIENLSDKREMNAPNVTFQWYRLATLIDIARTEGTVIYTLADLF